MTEPDFDPADFKPGTMGCHEALHMASVALAIVDDHLCQHPAIATNGDWLAIATRALEDLYELYQAIGAAHNSIKPAKPTEELGGWHVRLSDETFSAAVEQARSEGLSLSEYLSKAVDTDIAVAEISREKIG